MWNDLTQIEVNDSDLCSIPVRTGTYPMVDLCILFFSTVQIFGQTGNDFDRRYFTFSLTHCRKKGCETRTEYEDCFKYISNTIDVCVDESSKPLGNEIEKCFQFFGNGALVSEIATAVKTSRNLRQLTNLEKHTLGLKDPVIFWKKAFLDIKQEDKFYGTVYTPLFVINLISHFALVLLLVRSQYTKSMVLYLSIMVVLNLICVATPAPYVLNPKSLDGENNHGVLKVLSKRWSLEAAVYIDLLPTITHSVSLWLIASVALLFIVIGRKSSMSMDISNTIPVLVLSCCSILTFVPTITGMSYINWPTLNSSDSFVNVTVTVSDITRWRQCLMISASYANFCPCVVIVSIVVLGIYAWIKGFQHKQTADIKSVTSVHDQNINNTNDRKASIGHSVREETKEQNIDKPFLTLNAKEKNAGQQEDKKSQSANRDFEAQKNNPDGENKNMTNEHISTITGIAASFMILFEVLNILLIPVLAFVLPESTGFFLMISHAVSFLFPILFSLCIVGNRHLFIN